MNEPKKARVRITVDRHVMFEARIDIKGDELDLSSQIRRGPDAERFCIDSMLASLWNIVPDDDIKLRAVVFSGMVLRGMTEDPSKKGWINNPPPVDNDPEDDIPF